MNDKYMLLKQITVYMYTLFLTSSYTFLIGKSFFYDSEGVICMYYNSSERRLFPVGKYFCQILIEI